MSMSTKNNSDIDVEEAIVPEQANSPTGRVSLSATEKPWDITGDGQLDEAELALKGIDKTKKGTLSKEQMYNLMQENLKVRGELAKVKKLVILLAVLTVFLACANIALSFASAFLAKDTKTSNGKLVDSSTGVAVKTDSTTMVFNGVEVDASERKLFGRGLNENVQCNEQNSANPNCWNKALTLFAPESSPSDGAQVCQAIQNQCESGGSTSFRTTAGEQFSLCPNQHPVFIKYNTGSLTKGSGFTIYKEEGEAAEKVNTPLYRIGLWDPSPGEAPLCVVMYSGWYKEPIYTLGGPTTTLATATGLTTVTASASTKNACSSNDTQGNTCSEGICWYDACGTGTLDFECSCTEMAPDEKGNIFNTWSCAEPICI